MKGKFSLELSAFVPRWSALQTPPQRYLHVLQCTKEGPLEDSPESLEELPANKTSSGSLMDDLAEYEMTDVEIGGNKLALFSDLDDDESPPEQSQGVSTYPPSAPVAICKPEDDSIETLVDAMGSLSTDDGSKTKENISNLVVAVPVAEVTVTGKKLPAALPEPVPGPGESPISMLINSGLKDELLSKSPRTSSSTRSAPSVASNSAVAGAAPVTERTKNSEADATVSPTDTDGEGESDFGKTTIDFQISDEDFLQLSELQITVTKDTSVEAVRKDVFDQLKQLDKVALEKYEASKAAGEDPVAHRQLLQPHQINSNFVRLRATSYYPNKPPTDILRDGTSFEKAISTPLTNDKKVQIQLLDYEEKLPVKKSGDVVVFVQRWHRDTWSLGPRYEVYVPGAMRFSHIATKLAELLQIEDPEHTKALFVDKTNCTIELSKLKDDSPTSSYVAQRKWFEPFEMQITLKASKLYLLSEGDLILVQDTSEPLRELTEAENESVRKKAAAKKSYGSSYNYGYSTGYSSYTRPSGGVKIKTQIDRAKESEDSNSSDSSNSKSPVSPMSPMSTAGNAGNNNMVGPELPPPEDDPASIVRDMGLD